MATGVQVWSQVPATNATADTNVNWAEGMAPSAVDDSARAEMASVAKWRDDNNGTLVTSGSSTAFTLVTNQVASALTNGYTIRAQLHVAAEVGATMSVDGLTAKPIQLYNGTSVTTNYEFKFGSIQGFTYLSSGTGQWVASGFISPQNPPTLTTTSTSLFVSLTKATTATIALNNTALYFDGPSISQGSSGTWFVSGSVTLSDTVAAAFNAKLWDGTTTIASGWATPASNAFGTVISLSGVIASPAGNLRISAQDVTSVNGTMKSTTPFGAAGGTNASIITAFRIG